MTADPPTALVWYAGASTAVVPNGELRTVGLDAFDVEVVTLPPDDVLVGSTGRRAAIGQLVFYEQNDEDGGMSDGSISSYFVFGAPVGALVTYLEGTGERPGFNWLKLGGCDDSACCGPAAVQPISTIVDFDMLEYTDGVHLCSASRAAPACAPSSSPLFPTCP